MLQFASGKDVFTGYRKSLCYALLPEVFDRLRGVEKQLMALVVSPLLGLMQDQVTLLTEAGVSAVSLHHSTTAERAKIKQGFYQVIFASPENILLSVVQLEEKHASTNLKPITTVSSTLFKLSWLIKLTTN